MSSVKAKRIAYCAIMSAIITVATAVIAVPLPAVKGYMNGGEILIFTLAYFVGGIPSVIAAGLGSALADLLLSFGVFAPFTFVIKSAEAFVFILAARRKKLWAFGVSAVCAVAVMVGGYFMTEWILYGFTAAIPEVIPNLLQSGLGAVAAFVIIIPLRDRFPSLRIYLPTKNKCGGSAVGSAKNCKGEAVESNKSEITDSVDKIKTDVEGDKTSATDNKSIDGK